MSLSEQGIPGGLTPQRPANAQIQKIADLVEKDVFDKLQEPSVIYRAHSYKTQVVSGVLYFIKVQVAREEYIVIKILHEPCNAGLKLIDVKRNRTEDDEINPF